MGVDAALAALDRDVLARDLSAAVRVPSVTGDERAVLELLAGIARDAGLDVDLHRHDLAALRAHPDCPGEEVPRAELWGLAVTLEGEAGRLCVCAHVDVVPPGSAPWRHGPWSGETGDGFVHGRGSVDMKGGAVAALHALAALRAGGTRAPEVVLQLVSSEEDGGLGAFAALERDAAFDGCVIPEPTGFVVICAQAGALTFKGTVRGRAAHAAERLAGRSAIDRYLTVHEALAEHERALNRDVEHPLMRALALPYPVSVGRLEAGEWASSVPDRLVFEGRLGVRVGEDPAAARAALAARLRADDVEIEWTGGAFASAETPVDHPWVARVRDAVSAALGREAAVGGVPWGADMRLYAARGIPTVMVGTSGIELAHAVDERVRLDEVETLARALIRVLAA
jgi:acetylornithine deacetylase